MSLIHATTTFNWSYFVTDYNYKVVSYITSTASEPFIHGYYATEQEAIKVRDDYNKSWSHGYLTAHVEAL